MGGQLGVLLDGMVSGPAGSLAGVGGCWDMVMRREGQIGVGRDGADPGFWLWAWPLVEQGALGQILKLVFIMAFSFFYERSIQTLFTFKSVLLWSS